MDQKKTVAASSPEKLPASGPTASAPPAPASPGTKREDRSDWKAQYEHDRTARKIFKLRVVYNRKGCIGSSHCILSDPYNFELDEQTRAILKGGEEMPNAPGIFVKVIETDSPHLVINAAKTCTPKVISIIDVETGKRIAP